VRKRTTFATITAEWEQLLAAVEANRDELPQVEAYRVQLEASLEDLRVLQVQRATLEANRLRATRDLKVSLDRGKALAGRLREWIRGWYGSGDKLIEFGMKPRRKRRARGRPGKEEGAPRKPTEP
jgi:hypothetical protein